MAAAAERRISAFPEVFYCSDWGKAHLKMGARRNIEMSELPRFNFKKFFSFTQDADLRRVNEHLKDIIDDTENERPGHTEIKNNDVLIREIRKEGNSYGKYTLCMLNIEAWNAKFERANRHIDSKWTQRLLKIINCLRNLFGWEEIKLERYHTFNTPKFDAWLHEHAVDWAMIV